MKSEQRGAGAENAAPGPLSMQKAVRCLFGFGKSCAACAELTEACLCSKLNCEMLRKC